MEKILAPSLNCANFDCLRDEVVRLDAAGADMFHLDICDGVLTDRLSMGLRDLQSVRRNTKKPVDVHLYMMNPMRHIDAFVREGADIIYVFPESERFIANALYYIRQCGRAPGLAVGWGASVEALSGLLPLVDYVMVNTANPVSPGRDFMDEAWETLQKLIDAKRRYPFKLLVDGAITPDIISKCWKIGVDGFSMGTGCLFGPKWESKSYETIFKELRAL